MAWTKRYVRADAAGGGDGTTDASSGASGAFTLAEAITHSATNTGIKYIVKGAHGAYANTTTSRTFNGVGLTTAPNWWAGCNNAEDDLDSDDVTAKPSITFTTGNMVVSGSFQVFSNISISGQNTVNAQLRVTTGGNMTFDRVRVENTAANANARAMEVSAGMTTFTRGWAKCTSSADVVNWSANDSAFVGWTFEGGANALVGSGAARQVVALCSFNNVGGDAYRGTAAQRLWWILNTVYSPGSDGIEFTAAPTLVVAIGSLFSECAVGINNSTGGNLATFIRLCNLFHGSTSSNEAGMGDTPSWKEQTDSSSPFTNAAGGDLSLVSTSNAKANGPPGKFENQSYTSYLDIGAVQRQEPAGGGGLMVHPGMTGGVRG